MNKVTNQQQNMLGYLRTYGIRALKLYAIFGVVNVVYKFYLILRARFRAQKLWAKLPGKDMDLTAKRLAKAGREGRFHDFFASYGLEYPDAAIIKCDTPNPVLMCNSAESIKWMLKDEFANITKPAGDDYMFELMKEFLGGKGIFVLRHGQSAPQDNDIWHKERKVSSLIFTKSNFESLFYDTFVEKAKNFITRLEKSNNEKVDMQELFFSFTMDSIEKFFMGTEVNTIDGGMSDYARAFDKAHNSMMKIVIRSIQYQIPARMLLPYPIGNLLPQHATRNTLIVQLVRRLNPNFQDFFEAINHLDDHVRKYIKQTRADPNLKSRKDIIANFLNSSIGDEVTDDMLRDLVLNLTIAGRDTTACALSWMFFQLTQNPEVQQKLMEEIDTKLQGRVPTLADLEATEMPYLNGAIYETLRLHPPVPTEAKIVTNDICYLDGTPVPKGTKLMFSAYSMGRNPTRYPNPMKFDPARWIPFQQPSLYEFPVFQAGPRFCLGKDMAQFEMKLLTCMILQKFSFTLLPGEAEKISYTLMLTQSIANNPDKSSTELWCIPHKRD